MAKKIVVRLRKGSTSGEIVANSQVITLDGITDQINAAGFDDNSLTGSVKSYNRSGAFIKTLIPLLEQQTGTESLATSVLSTIDFTLHSEYNSIDSPVPGAVIRIGSRVGASGKLYRTYILPSLDIKTQENNFSQFVETGSDDVVVVDSIPVNGVYYVKVSDALNTDNFRIKSVLVNHTQLKTVEITSTTTSTTTSAPPRVRCNFELAVKSFGDTRFFERFDQYVVDVLLFDSTTCLTNYSIKKYNMLVKIVHYSTTDDDIILNKSIFDINFNSGTKIQIPVLIVDDGVIEPDKEFAFQFFLPNDIISSVYNSTPFYTSPKCTIISNNISERVLYPNLKLEWVGIRPNLKTTDFYTVEGQALELRVSRPIHLPPLWNSVKVIGHNGTEIVRTNAQISNGNYETFSFPQGFFTNKQAPYKASANVLCYLTTTATGAVDYYELANINVVSANIILDKTEVIKGEYVTVSSYVKGHDITSPVRLVLTGDTALNFSPNDIASIDGQPGTTIEKLTDSNGFVSFSVLTATGVTSVISSVQAKLFIDYTVTGKDGVTGRGYGQEITEGQTPSFNISYSPDVRIYPQITNEIYNKLEFLIYESQNLIYTFSVSDVNFPQGREIYWRVVFLGGAGPDDFLDLVAGNFNSSNKTYEIIINVAPDNINETTERFRIDFYLSQEDQINQIRNFWSSQEFQIVDPTIENIFVVGQNKLPKLKPFIAAGEDRLINLFQVRILLDKIIVNNNNINKTISILGSLYQNYEWTINFDLPGIVFTIEGLHYIDSDGVRKPKAKQEYSNSKTVKSVSSTELIKVNFLANNNKTPNRYGRVRVFASDAMIVGDFYEFVLPINI